MTEEEQRIAIAEACGWTCDEDGYWSHPDAEMRKRLKLASGCPPDFLHDLNAMHEIESVAPRYAYYKALCLVVVGGPAKDVDDWAQIVSATAAQRAEAFLRTLNLWKEE